MPNGSDHDAITRCIVELEHIGNEMRAGRDWQEKHDTTEREHFAVIKSHMDACPGKHARIDARLAGHDDNFTEVRKDVKPLRRMVGWLTGAWSVGLLAGAYLAKLLLTHLGKG